MSRSYSSQITDESEEQVAHVGSIRQFSQGFCVFKEILLVYQYLVKLLNRISYDKEQASQEFGEVIDLPGFEFKKFSIRESFIDRVFDML